MILAGRRAEEFCRAPDRDVALLFGPDRTIASEAAQALCHAWSGGRQPDPLDVTNLTEACLTAAPGRLFEALEARALFGSGTPIVRLRLESERSATKLIKALERITDNSCTLAGRWLIEAGDLKSSARLRTAFAASPIAVALSFAADSIKDVARLAQDFFDKAGITIDKEAIEMLAAELPGHRLMARMEMEKLALYAGSLDRAVGIDDVAAIVSAELSGDARQAAQAALAGTYEAADRAAERFLSAGGAAISGLRTLHFSVLSSFSYRRSHMSPEQLVKTLCLLLQSEKNCKQASIPAHAIYRDALARIARRTI